MSDALPKSLTLNDILDDIWAALADGLIHARDPFHTPTVGTVRDGTPQLRTVVLRHVDREAAELGFHTDVRSLKRSDLEGVPQLAWHFYDRERKVQLRIQGRASLHTHDDVADHAWEVTTPLGRRCYGQTLGPGHPTDTSEVPLPFLGELEAGHPDTTARCRDNFCVVRSHLTEIDWLYLHFRGHQRVLFKLEGAEWSGRWIAP